MNSRSDTRALVAAAVAAALLVCELVSAKAARDALFLGEFGARALPGVMVATSALALLSAFGAATLMRRQGPAQSTASLLFISATLLFGEAVAFAAAPKVVIVVIYLQVASLGAALMSGFWSVVTERFDPYSARAAVTRIAAAASLGGLAGGLSAAPLLAWVGPRSLLAVLATLHLAAALLLLTFRAPRVEAASEPHVRGAASVLKHSRYLQSLALLVVLTALCSTLLDYVLKARAADALRNTAQLATFFGLFYTLTSVLSALIQLAVTRRALEGVGLGGTLSALPVFVVVSSLLALFLPELWPLVLLRGGAQVLENTFFRSAYEPLYTPLAAEKKRAVKTVLDVASERFGDLLGAGLVVAVVAILPGIGSNIALAAAAITAFGAAVLSLSLHRGYVSELAQSLRLGVVKLTDADVRDRTTRLTLSQTAIDIDRGALLRQITELQQRSEHPETADGGSEGLQSSPPPPSGPAAAYPRTERAAVLADAQALLSDDDQRIRSVLARGVDRVLVPVALPLLMRDELVAPVSAALRSVASESAGAMSDALLDVSQPHKLRRRIPHVLEAARGARVVAALSEALAQDEFDVRYRAALALCSIAERDGLSPPRELVFAAVERELELFASAGAEAQSDGWEDVEHAHADPKARRIKYVFTLLALVLEREPMELALRALGSSDRKLRGTALEYLENVLPARLREALWPHLGAEPTVARAPASRPRQEIVDELKTSLHGLDVRALRAPAGRHSG